MKTSFEGERYTKTATVGRVVNQAIQRIEALPGVRSASLTAVLPAEGSVTLPFTIEGHPPKKDELFSGEGNFAFIAPHYFDTFGIHLLRGRAFTANDTASSAKVAAINEAMAGKYWPGEDPLGRRVTVGGKVLGPEFEEGPRQIVGIVATVRQVDLGTPGQSMLYVPHSQVADAFSALVNKIIPMAWAIRTLLDPLSLTAAVQREMMSGDVQITASKCAQWSR